MAEPLIYIDHSDVREGKLPDVRAGIKELVDFVEANEPQLLTYGFYIDEERMRMTLIAIHPDSASLEMHMDIGGPAFRKFIELIDLRTIEVYGRPSDKALEQLQQKMQMLGASGTVNVYPQHAGFARGVSVKGPD